MNCGAFICFTVFLDKLNDLTVECDPSVLTRNKSSQSSN